MEIHNRRAFLQISAGALTAGLVPTAHASGTIAPIYGIRATSDSKQTAPVVASNAGKKPLRLGLIIEVEKDPDVTMRKLVDLGLLTAQLYVDDLDPKNAAVLRQSLDNHNIEATSVVVGGPGKEVWDFYGGPLTIGLVPADTRVARINHIKKASDFAKLADIPAVQSHCGFIPENPNDPVYKATVEAMRDVATHCKRNGQNFRYETGQETPITLIRAIRDAGVDNQGINFDLANLVMYGKANPVDAIELIAPYVQGIHAKDGMWPTNPRDLGEEVPIGKGKVDFPRLIARLKELNYGGAVTIEREVSGPDQIRDVREAKKYLEQLIG
jgi:sugar phosphate isomerase/epimerase